MSDDPLDQINRFLIALVALAIMFGALALVLIAWGASDGAIGRLEDFAGYLRDHDGRSAKAVLTLAALVLVLLMAMAMILELTPSSIQRMRIRDVKGGDATLTTQQIAQRIEDEIHAVEHIAACMATVAARGERSIEVVLDLQVDAGANLARTADEVCRRADALVQGHMGIKLAHRPRARMHYRELRLDGGKAAPQQPETGWERPDEGAQ